MGEYIKNIKTGEEIKIGVMDKCFHSRTQMEKWLNDPEWTGWYADKEEDGTISYYLNNPNTIYKQIENLIHNKFAIKIYLDDANEITHDMVYVSKMGKRLSGYQYKVDCQLKGGKEIWASIFGERYDENGNGRTIFACDCCEAIFSLPKKTITYLLENMSERDKKYFSKILKGKIYS